MLSSLSLIVEGQVNIGTSRKGGVGVWGVGRVAVLILNIINPDREGLIALKSGIVYYINTKRRAYIAVYMNCRKQG